MMIEIPDEDAEFQLHAFSYQHNGAVWSFHIYASSPEDARQRLVQLQFSRYNGVVRACIPAGDPA